MGDNTPWILLGLLFLLSGGAAATVSRPGTVTAQPVGSVAGLTPGGAITNLSLGQDTHKLPSDLLNVQVSYLAGTTRAGRPIPWHYTLRLNISGSGLAGPPFVVDHDFPNVPGGPGNTDRFNVVLLPALGFQPGTLLVLVSLFAADVTPTGQASGSMINVGGMQGTVIIDAPPIAAPVVPAPAPVSPIVAGQITNLTLSQEMGLSREGGRMRFLRLEQDYGKYNPNIGGILDPNAQGLDLKPIDAPVRAPTSSIGWQAAHIGWQAQSAAMTRPREAFGKDLEQQGPFSAYKMPSLTGVGVARPTFTDGVLLNTEGYGGVTPNGPGGRYAWGQNAFIPWFQPVRPRGSVRGYS